MTARTDRKPDRDLLITLAGSLSVSQGRLRRDPCGDWTIVGRHGHALTDGTDAFVYLPAGTARRWTKAKRTLQFMQVTQDGDTEGILKFDGVPTADQGAIIRKVLGLRKVTPLTDEQRDAISRRLSGTPSQTPISDRFIGPTEGAPTNPPGDTENPIHDAETADSPAGVIDREHSTL
jgi:hypothetical protein